MSLMALNSTEISQLADSDALYNQNLLPNLELLMGSARQPALRDEPPDPCSVQQI